MKTLIRSFLPLALLALVFALPVSALAQDAAAPAAAGGISADNIVQWLTPILVPLLIAGFKKVAPALPSWVLPILAPVLGVVIDLVNSFASGHSSNLLVAAALGLAGVGLRELKDQVKPAPNGGWPAGEPKPID